LLLGEVKRHHRRVELPALLVAADHAPVARRGGRERLTLFEQLRAEDADAGRSVDAQADGAAAGLKELNRDAEGGEGDGLSGAPREHEHGWVSVRASPRPPDCRWQAGAEVPLPWGGPK